VLVLTAALLVAACSRPFAVSLPDLRSSALEVPGDRKVYEDIWETGCNLFQVTARLTLRGSVAGKRPRSAMWIGGSGSGGFRIESDGGGRSFVLTSPAQATPGATLQLPDGRHVVSADVAALVQLATGLPLTGRELQSLVTTCPTRDGGGPASYRPSSNALDLMFADSPEATDVIHFARDDANAAWRLVAMTSNRQKPPFRWRTEFHAPIATVPKTFRLIGLDWRGQPTGELDVLVTVDRVQVSPMIDPRLFEPSGASDESLTLDELKASGMRLPLIVD